MTWLALGSKRKAEVIFSVRLFESQVIIPCYLWLGKVKPELCVHVNGASEGLEYLIEEALAELVHGALQLAALALPLLIVAHGLGRGPLPCGGSGVVVHVIEPAPLVHTLLPAEGGQRGALVFNNIFIKHAESG